MLLPMYRDKGRSQFVISAGIRIYDVLALGSGFPRARVLKPSKCSRCSGLSSKAWSAPWAFFLAQMDGSALGNWVVDEFCDLGGDLVTEHEVRDLAELDDYDQDRQRHRPLGRKNSMLLRVR